MNPVVALIISNVIWGAASPLFKYALTDIPPFTLAFCRFFFPAIIFLPFFLRYDLSQIKRRDFLEIIVGAFFGLTLNISFFFLALQKTESINAPIIGSSAPLFLFLFSVLFLKEKIHMKVLKGMIISFAGVLVIILAPILFSGKVAGGSTAVEGNMLLIVATISALCMPLIYKNVLNRVNPYVVTYISFAFAALTFLPFSLQELNTWSFHEIHTAGWVGVFFGTFFSSSIAYLLYYYGISKISVQEVGLFTYMDPIVSIIIAAPLLHEYPDIYFIAGSLLVFLGIFIAEGRLNYHPFHRITKHSI